jgi:E3 ubiquitin-protein ligase SIAH1
MGELKCPVCMRYMTPPIPMCVNGHNICNTCRQKMNQCPTCRQGFSESRCWILENILQKIQYRCKYYVKGCEFVSTAGLNIACHEANCPLRPFRCPFADGTTSCSWTGEMNVMWNHIQRQHSSQCATASQGRCTFTLNCSGLRPSRMALSAWGETFFVVSRVINFDLYCCVLYVGPRVKGSTYSYTVTVSRRSRCARKSATVCQVTKSYYIDVQDIFRNPDCAVFPYVIWTRCADLDKKLSCEVEIR